MTCNAKPYEGTDAFLFVSYARKDAGIVYPLIERLASEGVRVWYDAGIHGGETWPEVIADHLQRCAACLVFMSQNAVASHNCFNELIFAVEAKKPLIPIRYNEAQLTLGMRMMIGAVQWIEMRGIPTEADTFRILALDSIKPVHGIADRSIAIQEYCEEQQAEAPQIAWKPEPLISEQEEEKRRAMVSETANRTDEPADSAQVGLVQAQEQISEPVVFPQAAQSEKDILPEGPALDEERSYTPRRRRAMASMTAAEAEGAGEKTMAEIAPEDAFEKTVAEVPGYDFEKTVAARGDIPPTLIVLRGEGIRYRGKVGATVLGRSKGKADIVIPDPERKVSGAHCRIFSMGDSRFVEDLHSTNGTWVDGEELPPEEKRAIDGLCELRLFSVRVLTAFEEKAETLWRASSLLGLRCQETGETRYIWQGNLRLGRDEPWRENVLKDGRVSHIHASIRPEGDGFLLRDEHSTNGTILNGERMESGTERPLETGDVIRIGANQFVVTIYHPEGESK